MADLERVRPAVDRFLRTARLTDAEFIYPPSLIAAAAFWEADPALTQRWIDSKRAAKAARSSEVVASGMSEVASLNTTILEAIAAMIAEHSTPQLDTVREIDRALQDCARAVATT